MPLLICARLQRPVRHVQEVRVSGLRSREIFPHREDYVSIGGFVLSQSQVNEGVRVDWESAKAGRKAKDRSGEPADRKGVAWNLAEDYGDKWEALPE